MTWIGRVLAGFCVAGLVFTQVAAAEPGDDQARIIATGREDNKVMEHLDILCNRLGPRLTSSDSLTNACAWARDRFQSFGIENARLDRWGEFPVGFNRGPWFGRVVEPEPRSLEFITMSWSAGTKGIVRGPAVLAPKDAEELEKVKESLKGAWVLSPLPSRTGPRPPAEFLRTLPKALEDAGVAGTIRSARAELLVTAGNWRVDWEKLPTTPAITLKKSDFDAIAGKIAEGPGVTLEFDIRNYFKQGPIPLDNVIADIPGTDKADEYVIVGGHLDAWDGSTGATDNGTGVATTLEAARILMKAGVKPRRTIRFMLWGGEEQGLLGSAAYVRKNPELMPKISAVLVHDGGTNYLSGIGATEAIMSDLSQVFEPVTTLDPALPFEVRKVPGLSGGGSDHASFLSAGVPGFFWRQAGRANYTFTHHTQHDTFGAAIPEYQKHSALVVALGAFGIANLDQMLSREKLRSPGAMANRRLLGVQLDELTIVEVIDDGVAHKAGVRAGDVIVKVDGKMLGDRDALVTAIQAGPPKKSVTVLREGKEVEFTLEWPAPVSPPVKP